MSSVINLSCSNEVVEEELAEVEESGVEACSTEDEITTKNGCKRITY